MKLAFRRSPRHRQWRGWQYVLEEVPAPFALAWNERFQPYRWEALTRRVWLLLLRQIRTARRPRHIRLYVQEILR